MTLTEILAYLGTGILSGLLAGLLGVGGGVIIVPALILVFGHLGFAPEWLAHLAVGTSLASIIGTGWSSALAHHRRGAVQWDLFWRLIPGIILGAWAGAAIAGLLPQTWLQRLFGGFLVYVGVRMLRPREQIRRQAGPDRWGVAMAGGGIGALSAIVGIGGGTLTVPYRPGRNPGLHDQRLGPGRFARDECGLYLLASGAGYPDHQCAHGTLRRPFGPPPARAPP